MTDKSKEQDGQKATGAKTLEVSREVGQLRRAYYQRLVEAPERGYSVAWTMFNLPYDILDAFDVVPSYVENYGPVCAAKQIGDYFCEVAEGEGFSPDHCPYMRTGLGIAKLTRDLSGESPPEAPYGGLGKPNMLISLHQFCDGRIKWLQQVGRYLDVPFLALDFKEWPEGWDENDQDLKKHMVEHYLGQMRELVVFLERVTGKKFNKYRVSEYLQNFWKVSRLFNDALEFQKCRPCPMSAQDALAVAFPYLVMRPWPESVEFYQKLYDELRYRVENKIGWLPEEKYRLLWYWLPPWYYLGLYDWLAQTFGAVTIANGYEPGPDLPPEDLIDYDFPLESMAKAVYEGSWNGSMMRRRTSKYYRRQVDFAREHDIDGALCMLVSSCRGTNDMYHAWNILKNGIDVPTLSIEADMVDTRTYSDALIKDKITAFMETVETVKRKSVMG
jgi:benzoyl-CoA reductase/2-hydroxyglutaryl-CoA dehydratase subunit BcrC/BadD/HgdB